MVNILFLIGNGFDLNLGLNTKYSDVVKDYLERDHGDPVLNEFKEELKREDRNWSDFEREIGEYSEKFNLDTKNKLLHQKKGFCNVLMEKFEIEEKRIDYLSNTEIILSVFKESLTNFDFCLSEKSKQALSSIISTSLNNCNFQYDFISFNYTNVLDKCIEIVKSIKGRNYFRTVQNFPLHSVNDNIGKILHIHGTLREDFILGVDNPSQIANIELSKDEEFIWEMVKTKMNEELDENYDSDTKKMIDASSIICTFGMSLGKTDKTWWEYILKWLGINEKRHLVIFFYDENIDDKIPASKIKHKHKVRNDFFEVAGCINENQKGVCKNRVHIAKKNGDMFKMDILSKNEVTNV